MDECEPRGGETDTEIEPYLLEDRQSLFEFPYRILDFLVGSRALVDFRALAQKVHAALLEP